MYERLTKKCVKVVKAKSAKVQGARACARARRGISPLFTTHDISAKDLLK